MTSQPSSNTLQIQTWLDIFQIEKITHIILLTIAGRNIRLRKFLRVSGHSCSKLEIWKVWVVSSVLRNITYFTCWRKFNLSVEFLLWLCFHVIGDTCWAGPDTLITSNGTLGHWPDTDMCQYNHGTITEIHSVCVCLCVCVCVCVCVCD